MTQDKQQQYNVKAVKVFVYALDSIKKTEALAEIWSIQLTPELSQQQTSPKIVSPRGLLMPQIDENYFQVDPQQARDKQTQQFSAKLQEAARQLPL